MPCKVGAENRATDMEHHTGIESLLGWVQRECKAQMQQAQSWEQSQNSVSPKTVKPSVGSALTLPTKRRRFCQNTCYRSLS
jgi:hypothetical protein